MIGQPEQPFLEWNDAFTSEWNSPSGLSDRVPEDLEPASPTAPVLGSAFSLEPVSPDSRDGDRLPIVQLDMRSPDAASRVDPQLRALREYYEAALARERASHEAELAGTRDQVAALEARLELSHYTALGDPGFSDVFESPVRGPDRPAEGGVAEDEEQGTQASGASSPSSLFREAAARGPAAAAAPEGACRRLAIEPAAAPPRPPADEVRHCQSEIASLNRRLDRASESLCKATYAIKVLHFKLQHERRTVGALQADKCCLQARLLQVGGRCPDYGAPEEGAPVAANAYEAGMAELARRLAAAEDAAATADALREELSRARAAAEAAARRELEAEERAAATVAEAERLAVELMDAREREADLRHQLAIGGGDGQGGGVDRAVDAAGAALQREASSWLHLEEEDRAGDTSERAAAHDGILDNEDSRLDDRLYSDDGRDAAFKIHRQRELESPQRDLQAAAIAQLQRSVAATAAERDEALERLGLAERALERARARASESEAVTRHVVGDLSDMSGLVDAVQALQARNRELSEALDEASAGNAGLRARLARLAERADELERGLGAETRLRAQAEAEAEGAAARGAALRDAVESASRAAARAAAEAEAARAERDAAAAGSKRTAASLREALRLLQALNAERGAQEGREAALADARRAVAAAEEERDRARAALDRARTASARSREQAGAAEQRALRAESALATLSEGLAAAQDASLREAGALREARGLVSQAEARREADRAVVEGLVAVVAETCAAFCGSGAGVCAAGDLAWGAPDTCSANNNPSPIDALARRASEMLETAAARAHTWRQAAQGAPALSALVAALRDELSHRIADVASLESQNTTLRADLEFLSEQLRSARSDLDGRGAEIDRLRALGGEKDATVAGACERLERLGAESAARRDGDGIDAAAVGSSQQGVDGDWRRLRERLENALTSVESARARDGPGDEVPLLRGLCRLALAVTMQHVSDGGTDGVSSATVAAELDAWMAGRRELLGSLGLLAAWDALRDLAAKQELRGRASEAPRGPATWQRALEDLTKQVCWALGRDGNAPTHHGASDSEETIVRGLRQAVLSLMRRYRAALRVLQGRAAARGPRRGADPLSGDALSDSENETPPRSRATRPESSRSGFDFDEGDCWSEVSLRDKFGARSATVSSSGLRAPLTGSSSNRVL